MIWWFVSMGIAALAGFVYGSGQGWIQGFDAGCDTRHLTLVDTRKGGDRAGRE